MDIDSDVVLWCIAVPAVLAALTTLAAGLRSGAATEASVRRLRVAAGGRGWLAALGWALAMLVALVGRHREEFSAGWPEAITERMAWQSIAWPMLFFSLAMTIPALLRRKRLEYRWMLGGLAALSAAYVVLPAMENWQDLFYLHRFWMVAVFISCMASARSFDALATRGASAWSSLVLLASLATPTMLVATCYASPTEWCFAAIAGTLASWLTGTALGWWKGRPSLGWTIAYPGVVLVAAMTVTGRFYSYAEHPAWVYFVAMGLPVAITLVDRMLPRQATVLRIAVAALLAATSVAACGWELLA